MATLEFENVSKVYGGGVFAVRDLTLAVDDGEFVVLVGPSGCGKTTALRMLAGLEQITEGEIRIGGKRVNEVAPRERDIAMVFQNYALYPHMNVRDNLAYGLRVRRVPRAERRERVEHVAAILGLTEHLNRRPSQLSGGQRQRVAMGRAIIREPQAFLMDEPLSNLDARLRVQMRTEIARIQRDLQVTTVYVTHDQIEAMTMADRVAVMRSGILQQLDTPQRVYGYPANLFVATFIGSPAMNIVEGQLGHAAAGGIECRVGSYAFAVPGSLLGEESRLAAPAGRTVAVGIRPEAISVASDAHDGLRGTVVLSEDLGSEVMLHVEVDAQAVRRDGIAEELGDESASAPAAGGQTHGAMVVARLEAETSARRGARVALTFDTNRIHLFDLEGGRALGPNATGAPSAPVHAST